MTEAAVNQLHVVYDIFDSPLGKIYLSFSGGALCGVTFTKPAGVSFRKGAASQRFLKELDLYFRGEGRVFSQETRFLTGTEFEKKVWEALLEIPYGETRSYKWVAGHIGHNSALRAVGRALSKNPIPIVVPCHRVIEADGSIGGYSSGVELKKRLLDIEYYSAKK